MSTKRFIAKNGVNNHYHTIINVSDPVFPSDAATKNVTDAILVVAQAAFDAANNSSSNTQSAIAQAAFDAANTASANTIYLQGVNEYQNSYSSSANTWLQANDYYTWTTSKSYIDTLVLHVSGIDITQNSRISTVEANTIYLFGALNQTNSDIVTANTSLKSYVDSIETAQNSRISTVEANTIYLQGALTQTNLNIVTANTSLKSYVDTQSTYQSGVDLSQNNNISQVNTFTQSAYDTANAKFNTAGGNITGPVTISSNVTITGNLTVSGNVTTVSANNLVVQDNMIYLNDGSSVTNPDLGIAGNYNDGTYRHAGFFRDASDGYWKVYDQYLPEPDASPYIDTSNSSFRIADFQANNVTFGKITTSSTQVVTNLNADYLDGQHGSYYAVESIQSGINATQNTNISSATVLAQNAYNQANTDYTTISVTAGDYGGTTAIPVIKLAANGRISSISNTSITAGATITDDTTTNATRYIIFDDVTSGSMTSVGVSSTKLTYNPSTGTLSSTEFSGSGASLTSIPNAALVNPGFAINGTEIALGDDATLGVPNAATQVQSLGVGTGASGTTGEIRATNNITAYYSDDRLKTRLGNIENALDKIRKLQGFYYEANDLAQSMGYKPVREVGLSAQDTQKDMPEIVKPAPIDDEYLTVQYDRYAPYIVEAIKELADQIDEIKKHMGI